MNFLTSKKAQLAVTLLLCVTIIAGGSFAWFSATQNVLNEFTWNPEGANLHDDFTDPNKDVFVENTGTAPLLVRVQLREFMDINGATMIPAEADRGDKSSWPAHGDGPSGATDCDNGFHDYWTWDMGGQKWYLPATAAHIDAIRERTEGEDGGAGYDPADPVVQVPVLKDGLPTALQEYYADYDALEAAIGADSQMQDRLEALDDAKAALMDLLGTYVEPPAGTELPGDILEQIAERRTVLYTTQAEANTYARDHFHGVQRSREAQILTMAEWAAGDAVSGRAPQALGDYWVVDTNGWCYWANTLEPGEATGMLLNAVEATPRITGPDGLKRQRQRYYYGIDVTMQAATGVDVEKFSNPIYAGAGQAATEDAKLLLGRLAAASAEEGAAAAALAEPLEVQRGEYWHQGDGGVWMYDDGRWTYDGDAWLLDGESYPFTDHGWYVDEEAGDWWYIDDVWYFDGNDWYYTSPVPTAPPIGTPPVETTAPTPPAETAPTTPVETTVPTPPAETAPTTPVETTAPTSPAETTSPPAEAPQDTAE